MNDKDGKHISMPVTAKVLCVTVASLDIVEAGRMLHGSSLLGVLFLVLGITLLAQLIYYTEQDKKKMGSRGYEDMAGPPGPPGPMGMTGRAWNEDEDD
jgi:hypothetical protein